MTIFFFFLASCLNVLNSMGYLFKLCFAMESQMWENIEGNFFNIENTWNIKTLALNDTFTVRNVSIAAFVIPP